ncbi:MAG: glycosyltransferase family 4 protein [Anaerolineae bacterium]|nr:glycosyltransferase family 4 protein [Anaerolineae bacterium]
MPIIAINAYHLWPGQVGGTETYVRNLVHYLANSQNSTKYILIANQESVASLHALLTPSWQTLLLPPLSKNETLSFSYRVKSKLFSLLHWPPPPTTQEMVINKLLNAAGIDLIHFPQTIIHPLSLSIPCVLTFWDMQHEFFPEFFSESLLKWRRDTYQPSAQKAKIIIAPSQFTKQALISKYGIAEEKIRVIYFGVSAEFLQPLEQTTLAQIKTRYNLPPDYFFYPAASFPNKNHCRLLQAFHKLTLSYPKLKLVLTGMANTAEADLQKIISDLDLRAKVLQLGYVPYHHLPYLYAQATALVFPSLFEGYGIPVLEAMAIGCPVICSNTTSLPELVGEAALMVNPMDVEALTEAMRRILQDEMLRQRLVEKGRQQVAKFSWPQAVEQTIAVYRDILA